MIDTTNYSLHDSYVTSTPRKYDSPLRKEQAEATKSRIMEALSELIIEEHPSTISVPEVARRAGVSVRSVYHHFPTKDSLFEGLSPWINSKIADGARPTLERPQDLVDQLPAVIATMMDHRELFQALRASGLDERERTRRRLEERRAWIGTGLADATADLDERDRIKLEALTVHLMSFESFERLTLAGLEDDEAIETLQWALFTLVDKARRSDHIAPKQGARKTARKALAPGDDSSPRKATTTTRNSRGAARPGGKSNGDRDDR